jgi:hypothetical protein
MGVDLLIAETLEKQQQALAEAMSGGQQNEQAGKLREARLWYRKGLEVDPASTGAREKEEFLKSRMTADAQKPFDQASLAMKTGDRERAVRFYRQVVEQLLPGDELREQARKQLENLKP